MNARCEKVEHLLQQLRKELPPMFPRASLTRLTGGVVNSGTAANLDCIGKGPENRFKIGRNVIYERESFLAWLAERLESIEKGRAA